MGHAPRVVAKYPDALPIGTEPAENSGIGARDSGFGNTRTPKPESRIPDLYDAATETGDCARRTMKIVPFVALVSA